MGGSNPRPLAAALSRETDKISKYAADCSKLNLAFHPLVMDAYGRIPPNTVQCSESPHPQGQELCTTKLGCTHTAKAYWYQRLSVTLWIFNAYKVKPQSGIY